MSDIESKLIATAVGIVIIPILYLVYPKDTMRKGEWLILVIMQVIVGILLWKA